MEVNQIRESLLDMLMEKDATIAAQAEEIKKLREALEGLLEILEDGTHAGTNVDGKWMGVPDWEDVDKARAALE